jgi:hypothetical protein
MTVAATTGNVTVGGTLTTGGSIVVAASNNTGLTAQWDDGGASVGPYVTLSRLSPTPAAGDGLGGVLMNGRNSGAANVTYGQIYVRADTVTAGAEDSTIILNNYKDGSARTVMSLSSTQITLNDDTVISGAGTLTVGGTITTTGAVNTGALVATGNITATGNLTAQGANVFSGQNFISTTGFLYLAATGAGQIAFRPNGIASNSGQTTLASSGDLTVNGSVTAVGAGITAGGAVTSTQNFISSTANCYLGPTGAGTIILRPNGVGSGTGQFIVGSTGNATVNGTLTTDNVIFPATPVVSANANTLDTYEEGTWTPVVAGVTTAGAGTYTTQSGRYTKIGKSVFIECVIVWTAHTGTGGILITGLPFTSASVMATSGCINATNLTFAGQLTIQINATNTTINVISMTTGAAAANVAMDTAATIWINGHYTAAN